MQSATNRDIYVSWAQRWRTGFVLLIVAGLTMSWLTFPYLIQGKQLLIETGQDIKTEKMMKGRTLSQFLTKLMVTPNQEEITATFAIPEYFQFMDQVQAMARHRPEKYHVFFITENIHVNRLPQKLPSDVPYTHRKRPTTHSHSTTATAAQCNV